MRIREVGDDGDRLSLIVGDEYDDDKHDHNGDAAMSYPERVGGPPERGKKYL